MGGLSSGLFGLFGMHLRNLFGPASLRSRFMAHCARHNYTMLHMAHSNIIYSRFVLATRNSLLLLCCQARGLNKHINIAHTDDYPKARHTR